MAKRVGNVMNVNDLRATGIGAAAIRHFMFSVRYRQQLNLTEDALDASQRAVRRIGEFADRLATAKSATPALAAAADDLERDAKSALFDDLNAPQAMAALFEFIRRANADLDQGGSDTNAVDRARTAFALVNGVLDVVPDQPAIDATFKSWIESQVAALEHARARRDFATADTIRMSRDSRGTVIEDGTLGRRWKKVR